MTPGEPLIRWDWVADHVADIAERLGEHVLLAGIALAVGFAVSMVVGVYIARRPRMYAAVTWIAGILYTIPSLALFALLIPFTGLTLLTAEIGLVSYTLLILIRNVAAGIRSVPADVRETGLGMGYTTSQLLWKVELPLALGVIVAGLRIAAVTTIGLTTVTAIIGQGGLGALILDGLQLFFATPLIVGAALSIALAVVTDAALVFLQRAATPWARARG